MSDDFEKVNGEIENEAEETAAAAESAAENGQSTFDETFAEVSGAAGEAAESAGSHAEETAGNIEAQAEEAAQEYTEAPVYEAPRETAGAPEYENVYSGTQSAGEAPGQIPRVDAQRVTPQQPYGANRWQQQPGYSQYPAGGYQQAPYPGNGVYNGYAAPPAPPEKKKTGKRIFLAAIALVLVLAIGIAIGASPIFGARKKADSSDNQSGRENTTVQDDTNLVISDTPQSGTRKADGKALSTSEIAEIGRASNVGVVIYSGTSNREAGQGSGIVMGLDGTGKYTYIITCAHVISSKGITAKVETEDGKVYDAEIVGYDVRTDVGVLKVAYTGFTVAEFGDSDALSIGDPVYAVGNPGGVEFFGSFTGGHISAINRPISSEIGYTMKCIQHDAAINPGNSGGMLLNQYGQVVGINSQKIASSSYEGMSFSIPITAAKVIIDDLIQHGYVTDRAKLGIRYMSTSASTQYYMIAQLSGLPAGTVVITSINSDSSLNSKNVTKGDMIIAVNGKPMDTADVLIEKIDNGKIGDKLTLTICRVNSNYNIDKFDVEATLVEDRGDTAEEETTTQVNPFDYFFGY